ncbi:MAG: branched-chain amino acid ABC transporter ATP-binding protein/permease, partial [Acidimicrobiia bacterium]|nr:branched-chain amino acid ABC transporter ATP-binding protein/permease [Acidimicrobiia bacterium]
IGNTGVLSFGHLAFGSIAAYTCALLAVPAARKEVLLPNAPWGIQGVEINVVVATLAGVAAALVIGALLGLVMARTSGLAATMITLAFLFVVEAVAQNWIDLTNGAGSISSVPRLESRTWILLAVAGSIVVAAAFRHSPVGRFAQAGREDELAAGAMGIDLRVTRFAALVVSAGLVGLGGAMRSQSLGTVNPTQFSFELSVIVLAMLVVGGMRTISGAIVGTVLVTVGKDVFRWLGDGPGGLPSVEGMPDFFLAALLLAVLLTRPSGLLGDWDAGQVVAHRVLRKPSHPPEMARVTRAEREVHVQEGGAALVADGLGVTFGGFTAVDAVSLRVEPGEVRGLIGPNGAGKTTFVNLLTGMVAPSRGTASLGGVPLAGMPHAIARRGLARTFQNLRVFANLSVRENVAVSALSAARHRAGRPPVDVDELLAVSGLVDVADRPAATLDYGNQRRLEIARAAALRPDFLLLDEPTSGMSDSESEAMIGHVRAVAGLVGAGVLVIDHDLGFITSICDRITVLDQGEVIAEGTPTEVRADPTVIAAYLGSQADEIPAGEVRP